MAGMTNPPNPLYALISSNYANPYLREVIGPSFIPISSTPISNNNLPVIEDRLPTLARIPDLSVNHGVLIAPTVSKNMVMVSMAPPQSVVEQDSSDSNQKAIKRRKGKEPTLLSEEEDIQLNVPLAALIPKKRPPEPADVTS